jgi:long-chain acyl-CoA synthetase
VVRVDRPNVRGTLGVPFPGVDVAIMPPADYSGFAPADAGMVTPLPHGARGEVCVRGENVSPGYLGGGTGLPRRGEWLCTGDEGVRNADGTVGFLGVLKPMFTRNGFNVYPREIERVVAELPGVRSATVHAIPDPAREHEIALTVEGDVTGGDVRQWCEARLGTYKQPTRIEIV